MSALSDAIEIRDAARNAYLKALQLGPNYSINSGNASRSKSNYNIKELYNEWQRAEQVVAKLSNSSSGRTKFITVRNI